MKQHLIISSFILLLLAPFSISAEPEFRTWTRAEDQKTLEATLEKVDTDKSTVTLKLKNGKVVDLKIKILSEADQKWIAGIDERAAQTKADLLKKYPAIMQNQNPNGREECKWVFRYPAGVAPEDYKNRPLCVFFNASGLPKELVMKYADAADELGWITVGIHAYKNSMVQTNRRLVEDETKNAFKLIQEKIPHHEDKVVFSGFSGGAWWSFQSTAHLYPKAAGVISFGGWMSNDYDAPYPKKLKVAMVNGDKDKGACDMEEPDGDFLRKKKKATVKAFRFPGGHVIPPNEVTLKVMKWIHTEANFDGTAEEDKKKRR